MSELIQEGEEAEELIAQMAVHGFAVTRSELARWHRADLLGRPERRSQGRGRGMVSIYPAGTGKQLLALCEIHRSEKRLPYVAWRLWWAGYDIPRRYAQSFIDQAVATWQHGLRELHDLQANPEALAGFFVRSQTMRFSRKILPGIRKRVGRKNFPTVLDVFCRIMSGTFEGFAIDAQTGTDKHERDIIEMGLGLRRARTDRLVEAGPWLTGDIGEVLKQLSHMLRDHPLGEDAKTVGDADLLRARDEVRDFLSCMEGFSALADEMLGRGAFGYTALAESIREMEPQEQAFMILAWRMFRSWGWGSAMDELVKVAGLWHKYILPIYRGLEQLRDEVPAVAEEIAPKQIGASLRRKAAMVGSQFILQELSQHPAMKAFFERHPELPQLVDAYEQQKQTDSHSEG